MQVQKAGNQNQGSRNKDKESKLTTSDFVVGKPHPAPQAVNPPKTSSNQFDVLSSDTLEEGEMQQLYGHELEENPVPQSVSQEQADPPSSIPLWGGEPSQSSPIGEISPPSYADIAHKK